MADNDKVIGAAIGALGVAIIGIPLWIYDHVQTKNKYYSKGKEDGYSEKTIACEVKFRKQAEMFLAEKEGLEREKRQKDELIEKMLKKIDELEEEKKGIAKKSKKGRVEFLNGAVKNFKRTIERLRAA